MSDTFLNVSIDEKDKAIALGALQDQSGQLFVPSGLALTLFQNWLPAPASTNELALAQQPGLSLSELLNRCGVAVKSAFPAAVWVIIEISQIKSSSGHLYIGAIERDDDGKEVAKTTAMIWKQNVSKIARKFSSATGRDLAAGLKILVLAKPEFSQQYGVSLQITDIDASYTLGDMEARLKRIREDMEASGDANKNLSLPTPDDFHSLCIISPQGAAGLEDFQAEAKILERAGLCQFTYFEAIFQGDKTKESMKQAMLEAHYAHEASPFCALVIIRGGGAAADLNWLNELLLARMVSRFRAPVFTGIGHERDKSILDEYSNRTFGTPSKVIAHIRDVIAKKATQGYENWASISQSITAKLDAAESKITLRNSEIASGIDKKIDYALSASDKTYATVKTASAALIQSATAKIDLLNTTISSAATSTLDLATTNTDHRFGNVIDLAAVTLNAVAIQINNDFDSINLAARRSIDGIDEHLDGYIHSILGTATSIVNAAEIGAESHFEDLKFYARKSVDDAEDGSKYLMTGILAHGVEPTLRRGFAIVRNAEGPVSTRAAAERNNEMEIEFRDGSMKIKKGE